MKRKAIYLDANADLVSALDKLSRVTADEVVLVVPKGSVLFHSIVNLKILKSNAGQAGKSLALVTMDSAGRAMAHQIDLPVYKTLASEDALPETSIKSQADNNLQTNDVPTELSKPQIKIKHQRKLPQSQIIKEIKSSSTVPLSSIPSKSSKTSLPMLSNSLMSRNGLMIVFIVLAILILGGVTYFILPRATVNLDINSELFTHEFKLILADQNDLTAAGQNVFKGRFIEVTKELIQTFPATGAENKGNEASGFITIYNYTKTLKGLIPETRFVSPDGLVFRIKEDVLIAPAVVGQDGSLIAGRTKAKVVADTGGTDGNLSSGNKFEVPGLGTTGVNLVYGINSEPFIGGTDDEIKIVSQEDIESARESISKNVFLDTEMQIQELVGKNEELIIPLVQNDIIDSIPSVAAGARREAFDLKVQVRSWTLLPEQDRLESIIQNTVDIIISSNQALTLQTLQSARVVIDNADFLMHTIDFIVELDGLIASKIDASEIAGSISNRSPKNAEQLLDSVPDVISHKIVLWPFWVKRLPILENNIRIIFSYISP